VPGSRFDELAGHRRHHGRTTFSNSRQTWKADAQGVGPAVHRRNLASARGKRGPAYDALFGTLTSVWLCHERRTCWDVLATHPGSDPAQDVRWPRAICSDFWPTDKPANGGLDQARFEKLAVEIGQQRSHSTLQLINFHLYDRLSKGRVLFRTITLVYRRI
jgi:hypothetical protein